MPKADENATALAALSRAMADPAARPLLGTKAKPGIFIGGTQATKNAAQRAIERGWLAPTGDFEGQGRSKKPLYRITAAGIAHALEHGTAAELLRDMLAALDGQTKRLERVQSEVANTAELTKAQAQAVRELLTRVAPPNVEELLRSAANRPAAEPSPPSPPASSSSAKWAADALKYLSEHRRRNPYGRCSLSELFQKTAAGSGLSIGQFHDGVRELAAQGKIALHPFTGAAYQLRDEQYALVAGQEIKYYVDLVVES
jgi:hypothetical protein